MGAGSAGDGRAPLLVLIAEDNDTNRKLMRDVLALHGMRWIEAPDGTTAVALAQERLPDVVLMDIGLPDIDGVAALRLLRADARTAAIPVMAVTAYAMKGDAERLLAAGFDGYVSKPIDVRTFGDAVARLVEAPGA